MAASLIWLIIPESPKWLISQVSKLSPYCITTYSKTKTRANCPRRRRCWREQRAGMAWNSRSICSTPTLRARGRVQPQRSTKCPPWDAREADYFSGTPSSTAFAQVSSQSPLPSLSSGPSPPSSIMGSLSGWQFYLLPPLFNLSPLPVPRRSNSLRTPMSGTRCRII